MRKLNKEQVSKEVAKLHKEVKKLKAYDAFECHILTTTESEVDSAEYLEDIISYAQIVVEEYYDYDLTYRSVNALKRWVDKAERFLDSFEPVTEIVEDVQVEEIDFEKKIEVAEETLSLLKVVSDPDSVEQLIEEIKSATMLNKEKELINGNRELGKYGLDWEKYIYHKKGNRYMFGNSTPEIIVKTIEKEMSTRRILVVGSKLLHYDNISLADANKLSVGVYDKYDYVIFRGYEIKDFELFERIYNNTFARAFIFK